MFSLLFCLLFFTGCEIATSAKFNKCISENTFGLASFSDETFKVDYKWGKREDPYLSDGKTSDLVDYGVITVFSLKGKLKIHSASFKITIDDKLYEGDFLVNPYDASFVIDLKFIPKQTTDFGIEIFNENKSYKYNLKNVLSSEDADYLEVIKIAQDTLQKVIKEKVTKGETYEIYVRLINSQSKDFKPCWYISVYTTKNQLFAVAIDPKSKIVLARKV